MVKWILLLFPLLFIGQYTNDSALVNPVMEEFYKETGKRNINTSRVKRLDSIIFKDIQPIVVGDFYKEVYGYRHRINGTMWIELDNSLKLNIISMERTLLHELGHVMGKPHIIAKHFTDFGAKEIMSEYKYIYYLSQVELWAIKQRFYDSL